MRVTTAEVSRLVDGDLVGPDSEVDGASVDSRSIAPGQLFVPVVAERDGHNFVGQALERGAAAYLSSKAPVGGTAIMVEDTSLAFLTLAGGVRDRLPEHVVAITGSVGKTTVKDLAAAALGSRLRTHATRASFNNELGVPLTILATPADAEAVVVEMGARHPGDIALLVDLVRPSIGVITSIGQAHLEHLGGQTGVLAEKGSLIVDLPAEGYAILNDVDCGDAVRSRTEASVLTFGTATGDVRATLLGRDEELRPSVRFDTPWGTVSARLSVRGDHQLPNAAAALAVAVCAGVPLEAAADGLAGAVGSAGRSQVHQAASGLVVIDDAYNANPTSMQAALAALASMDVDRRVAVLGEMAELGEGSDEAHRSMADLAASLGIEVVAVRTAAYGVEPVSEDQVIELLAESGRGTGVLVKASRSVGLEHLVSRLTGTEHDQGAQG